MLIDYVNKLWSDGSGWWVVGKQKAPDRVLCTVGAFCYVVVWARATCRVG